MRDPSGPRQSAIAAVLIIVAASSFVTAAADEKSASHVAAEFGGYPDCNVHGRSYCLQHKEYPEDLIRILLQSRRFDFETLLLSEGDPSNEALEVKESVEVSSSSSSASVEVNKVRKKSETAKTVLEGKTIETTSGKPSSAPQSELGSSEGHYRKFLTARARSTTPKPLLVRTTESLFRAGDAGEISLDSLDIARIEDNVVSGTTTQEHVLHSIGQLFSSASDAADDDADERFDNEVDRAAVVVGHSGFGGDDDEGNLDLSNPLRSSISFETSKPPREDSFENFREVEEGPQRVDIGSVFDDKKKEIVRAFEAGIQEVEEKPDIEYSIYTIGGGNDTERRQNKRPINMAVVEIRSAVREAFQKHGRERLVTFDKSSKNSFVNGNSGEEVKGGDLKRHIVTVGHHKTSTASYSSRPTPTPYFYRVTTETKPTPSPYYYKPVEGSSVTPVYTSTSSPQVYYHSSTTKGYRNKNKSRRRKKPGGGQSVFKKHQNQPFHERTKKPDEIGEPLPYTEIEGPLIPILKSENIEQVAAPVLEGYNHQQKALFQREREESVESITPRARGGGFGVHNRLKQYTASHEKKVFRKLEDEPLPAASISSVYSTQTKKKREFPRAAAASSVDNFHIAPKVSPPSAAAVVVPATEGGKLLVLGDDINWSRPSGVYIPPGGSSENVHSPAPDFFELKPVLPSQQLQAVDESRSERSPLPTLWRKDVPGGAAYYKNKPFHQESRISVPEENQDGSPDIIYQPGQGADDHVRFIVQTVGTKDPVSNYVDVTPRPDFSAERGSVLHGQFTTPGGHEALRPGAVQEDEYRHDYTDQIQLNDPTDYLSVDVKASVVPVPVSAHGGHELSGDSNLYEQPANDIDGDFESSISEVESGESQTGSLHQTLRYPERPRPPYNSRPRPRPSYFGIPTSITSLFSFFPGSTRSGSPYPAPPPRPPPPSLRPSFRTPYGPYPPRRRSRRSLLSAASAAESAAASEEMCPAQKLFVYPRIAYSVKGEWLYVVNLPDRDKYRQGIIVQECLSTKCKSKSCDETSTNSCEPVFVQKKLLALKSTGDSLAFELFWLPVSCKCQASRES